MTIPGIWGTELFGHHSLLLYGVGVMCVCEFLVAIISVTISTLNQSGQKALIALVCIISAFTSNWGPIASVITGDIFPANVRANAMPHRHRNIIIADIGLANRFEQRTDDLNMQTSCDSPGYAAPELVISDWLHVGTIRRDLLTTGRRKRPPHMRKGRSWPSRSNRRSAGTTGLVV